jgi:hypothetical protein
MKIADPNQNTGDFWRLKQAFTKCNDILSPLQAESTIKKSYEISGYKKDKKRQIFNDIHSLKLKTLGSYLPGYSGGGI